MDKTDPRLPCLGLLALAAFLGPGSLHAADAEYPVRVSVPEQVGDRYSVHRQMTQVLERAVKKGNVVEETKENNAVEFAGMVEILEVDRRGRASKVQVTIDRLVLTPGKEKPQEAAEQGTVVIGQNKDGDTTFSAKEKGQELSKLALHLLPRVLAVGGEVSEDDIFATEKPVKVGATWPADKKRLVEKFRVIDPDLKPEGVSGSGQLLGVKSVGGKEHLDVQITMSVQATGPAVPDLVPVELSVRVTGRVTIPADFATGPVEERLEVTMKQLLKGKPGTKNEGRVMEASSSDTIVTKKVYLKKK